MDELLTARLRLRRARSEDLADLHAVFSDPRAMRYWSTPPHTDLAQTQAWLEAMIGAPPAESEDFVIELRTGEHRGVVVGKAGCWRVPEVGFILRPDLWGQGLAGEAMSAVLPRVFDRFPVPALVADVDPRNAASLNLLVRLGFRETHRAPRTWLVGDEWCDSIYLALPRPGAEG
ncbi:MAG TPA: GNAT family N-acetyltransferase [Phenylobacterium sp.]|jgi:RimJ/RimL family protein N-acetyltransferase